MKALRLIAALLAACLLTGASQFNGVTATQADSLLGVTGNTSVLGMTLDASGLAQGDVVNKTFDGADSGYSWSNVGSPTDTTNPSGALAAMGANGRQFVFSGATRPTSTMDRGSIFSTGHTEYYRFFFHIVSSTIANTDRLYLFGGSENSDPTSSGSYAFRLQVYNNAAQYQVGISAGSDSTRINISVATWYRCEIKWVYNAAGELKIFNMAGTQVGSTIVTPFVANGVRYFHFGTFLPDNSNAMTAFIDGIGINSSAYLGI